MWVKKDNYHMQNGEAFIAKYHLADGEVKYGLTIGNKNHGYFKTADEAKAKFELIIKLSGVGK